MVAIVQHDAPWAFGYFPWGGLAFQQWVHNGKPSILIRDMAKYYRVDPRCAREAGRMEPAGALAAGAAGVGLLALAWVAGAAAPARDGHGARRRAGSLTERGRHDAGYILRRLGYGLLILIGVNLLTFFLFFTVNTPDDMARLNIGGKRITQEQIDKWKAERGYDRPLYFNAAAQGTEQITAPCCGSARCR
jgi:hypothetical protein